MIYAGQINKASWHNYKPTNANAMGFSGADGN
jgi:hypothetical protein